MSSSLRSSLWEQQSSHRSLRFANGALTGAVCFSSAYSPLLNAGCSVSPWNRRLTGHCYDNRTSFRAEKLINSTISSHFAHIPTDIKLNLISASLVTAKLDWMFIPKDLIVSDFHLKMTNGTQYLRFSPGGFVISGGLFFCPGVEVARFPSSNL